MKCDICNREIGENKGATWYGNILVCAECSSIKTAKELCEELGPLVTPQMIVLYLETLTELVEEGTIAEYKKNRAMITEEKRLLAWEEAKLEITRIQ